MSDDAIPSDSSARTANDRRMFGHLRNIRSACQYLQGRIADALKESAALSPKQRKERIAQVLDRPLLHRVDRTMEAALAAVQEIFAADPAEFEWSSDDVTSISLLWAQVQESLAA